MPLEDIPAYLRLTPEERKAAWDKHRLTARPLPAALNTLPPDPKRITSPPGVKDDDTDA
jgi:hypothetical protein